ncbi:MAG TPA: flagellar hook-associated protein FlgL [Bacteriovoracaceae bacterium]|nr:flagellar hook-associated protein FlgL [Bacteriovoracaceae bacterium]
MSRVSENSSVNSINYAVGKTKGKVEDLQLKGSTLKRVTKPSDDPVGNIELLAIRSQNIDATQYMRNLSFAQTQLSFTETVVEELTDILVKAKELAIGQASSIHSPEIRQGVSKEIHQLRQQVVSLANKRIGNRYLFSGQKVLTRPFDTDGKYHGDKSKINIEINKDVYIPINLTGEELFTSKTKKQVEKSDVDLRLGVDLNPDTAIQRDPASVGPQEVKTTIFDELRGLENALLTDNPHIIQGLLERLDDSIERVVTHRAEIGALTNTISNAETNIEKNKLLNEAHKSKIEDADVGELFAELQKEQNVLKATYQASANLMNTSLMDFIR